MRLEPSGLVNDAGFHPLRYAAYTTSELASARRLESPAATPSLSPVRVVEVVDREQWNALVIRQPHYDLEQGWEWAEVQREAGWTPHRYAAFRGGVCDGLVSVTHRRLPLLQHSVLYAPRGPLGAWEDAAVSRGLVGAVRDLGERCGAVFFRVSPGVPHDQPGLADVLVDHAFRPLPDDWTTWNTPRVTIAMDLHGSDEELVRRFRKRLRQNIAAAPQRGLRVRLSHDKADLATFHRLLVAMGREKRYPVRRVERLEALWSAYVARGNGVLALVEHEGALMAGLLGARLGRKAYLLCAAVVRDGANRPHGPSAYWAFIQWARNSGCELVDFGGSATHFPPRETDEGYGVYRFKAGFGSTLRYCMPYHDLIFRPHLYGLARAAERWLLPRAWQLRAHLNH